MGPQADSGERPSLPGSLLAMIMSFTEYGSNAPEIEKLKEVSPRVRKSMASYPHLFNNRVLLEVQGAPVEPGCDYNGFYEMDPETDNGKAPFVFMRDSITVALHKGGCPWQLIITPEHSTMLVAYSNYGTEKINPQNGIWIDFSSVKFQTHCDRSWSRMRVRMHWAKPESPISDSVDLEIMESLRVSLESFDDTPRGSALSCA